MIHHQSILNCIISVSMFNNNFFSRNSKVSRQEFHEGYLPTPNNRVYGKGMNTQSNIKHKNHNEFLKKYKYRKYIQSYKNVKNNRRR